MKPAVEDEIKKLERHVSKLCQWHIQKMKVEHQLLMRQFWKTMGICAVLIGLCAAWELVWFRYLKP